MNSDEINEIMVWLSKDDTMSYILFGDQLMIADALHKFAEAVKPIYNRYNKPQEIEIKWDFEKYDFGGKHE